MQEDGHRFHTSIDGTLPFCSQGGLLCSVLQFSGIWYGYGLTGVTTPTTVDCNGTTHSTVPATNLGFLSLR
jgi:hypothetical protein